MDFPQNQLLQPYLIKSYNLPLWTLPCSSPRTMNVCHLNKAQNTEIETTQHLWILVDKQCCLGYMGSAGISDSVLYKILLKISVKYLLPSDIWPFLYSSITTKWSSLWITDTHWQTQTEDTNTGTNSQDMLPEGNFKLMQQTDGMEGKENMVHRIQIHS